MLVKSASHFHQIMKLVVSYIYPKNFSWQQCNKSHQCDLVWFKELNDSTMNKARDAGGRRSDEWKYKNVVIFAFRFGKKGIRISEARAKIAREKVWPDRRLSNNSSSQFDVKMASLLKLANRLVLMYRLGLFFPVHYK